MIPAPAPIRAAIRLHATPLVPQRGNLGEGSELLGPVGWTAAPQKSRWPKCYKKTTPVSCGPKSFVYVGWFAEKACAPAAFSSATGFSAGRELPEWFTALGNLPQHRRVRQMLQRMIAVSWS